MKKLLTLFTALAVCTSLYAQAPQAFKYQAVARDNSGNVVSNSTIGFRISLLQGSPSGTNVYSETHTVSSNNYGLVNLEIGTGSIVSGTFSSINWGNASHFIKIEMDLSGGNNYVLMGTSQLLSVPYALFSEKANSVINDQVDDADANPTNEIQSLSINGSTLSISGGNSVTLPSASGGGTLDQAYDFGGSGAGRTINVDAGAVQLTVSGTNAIGLRADLSTTGSGLISNSNLASNTFSAVQATTNSSSTVAAAITGSSSGAAWGIAGQVTNTGTAQAAVYGSNLRTSGGHGVYGIGVNGVVGTTNYSSGYGVYGENMDAVAPLGNGVGTAGKGYYGVLGEDRYLGGVAGAYGVFSTGSLGASGVKTFLIDHPKDPGNKILRHFSIESNEVLNVYRGTAQFDNNGDAVINLPDYFSDINKNANYQLTPIGAQAQLYIKKKIEGNTFVIGGGHLGMEVSWIVTAERNDLFLQKNPEQKQVELEKLPSQRGKYFMPQLFGQPDENYIFFRKNMVPDKHESLHLLEKK